MPHTTASQHLANGGNRLLAVLPTPVRERFVADLDPVRMGFREVIYESERPIPYVYFPQDGVFSVITVVDEHGAVEVATVGNEGFVGLPVLLGGQSTTRPLAACGIRSYGDSPAPTDTGVVEHAAWCPAGFSLEGRGCTSRPRFHPSPPGSH